MLDIHGVSIDRGDKRVIDDITMRLEAGQLVALIGENGAGKSTLLHAFAGDTPYAGTIDLHGRNLSAWRAAQLAGIRAVMEQHAPVAQGMTVLELVMLGRFWAQQTRGEPESVSGDIAKRWLQPLNLTQFAHTHIDQLSGGELQRAHLARCMAQLETNLPGEQLLLADEPTAALDIHHQHLALHQLRAFANAGNLVLTVMHDLNLAMSYADTVVLLKNGQLHGMGKPRDVCTAVALSALYEHPMHVAQHPALSVPMVFAEPKGGAVRQ